MKRSDIFILSFGIIAVANPLSAIAQSFRPLTSSVQLPAIQFFHIRTAVSVPDGGEMSLGGVARSGSFGRSSGVPGAGRLFRDRSTTRIDSAIGSSVSVTILSQREMDEAVTAEGLRRQAIRQAIDPNGSPALQYHADFLTRNIGRR